MRKQDFDARISQVRRKLEDNPTLSDPTKIVLNHHREGPLFRKRDVLAIAGKCADDNEAQKIEGIVKDQLDGVAEVRNELSPTK